MDERWAHDYTQQFLSRCLFLYFIQRKRWLGNDPEFLRTFYQTYQDTARPTDTFVEKWINVLFFQAFNNRFQGGYAYFPASIRETLQLAPYLNGGLFRENELDTEYTVKISDELWQGIFTFFEKYNFTIAEDTPLDQEVAVDPEMIGKVYESLVSVEDEERGDAGIFYTPRIEIDLMCRLSLVDNLTNNSDTPDKDALKHTLYEVLFAFEEVEKQEADVNLGEHWQAVYEHLQDITVLDPACGSGSFLVGMLHILDDLHGRAEQHLGIPSTRPFDRRKALIGRNLYGVDVKSWACKVAELRLWLSLIIDAEFTTAELNVREEPLLPDFSFNIRHGDSIVQDIGGMNLAQTRSLGSGVSPKLQRKIEDLQTEKRKFYNGEEERKYEEKEEVEATEHNLFREILQDYETRKSKEIRLVEAWLEDPAEQLTLTGVTAPKPRQLSFETQQKQQELAKHKENLAQVQRARAALASHTTLPFVWDIAFGEIFRQRGGFDIIIENPPYVRQEQIADPTLPRAEVTTANKKEYKAKLARAIYQMFPEHFGYRENRNTVANKLDAKSDLYVYFYLHGLSLLNPKGTFCSITSNSWLDVGYGKNLQAFLLKKCHLKLVLDNAAKRSFKGVNINTIITLTSAPNETGEANEQHIVRFVNFTVPFEAILDPIIFYEVETATVRTRTPEHRIHPSVQEDLLTSGIGEKGKYAGDKWGAKYLRAPDIYWYLLENYHDKLIRVGDVADTPRGFTTGANSFFVLDSQTISTWGIEADFLSPVINSPRDVKSLLIAPNQLPYSLFMCSKRKSALRGTAALEYIKWGESQSFHQRSSIRSRRLWYGIRKRPLPPLTFPQLVGSTAKTTYAPKGCLAIDNFTEIHPSSALSVPLCLSLNSTVFQLMLNLSGCANRGYGFLKMQTSDLSNLLCVNPEILNISGGG